ncbi:GNAT family N-acetyltransferase [Isoptericola sp. b515]|uniref:GNAT family N-acetyltransferase n=1 Tax=Isoptericola sp. b515 TaxID=3064652 RepID=UPI002713193C|nr:GNAT family N-acetyltransferase [Isoptericola sp. b515]MDO8147481.1 GNAT family N-acetyltransferase [Isoptericola sp. b515]
MHWRIVEAPHVDSLDHPDSWAYRGIAEVERRVALADRGLPDGAPTPDALRAAMADQRYQRRHRVVAVDDGLAADDVSTAGSAPSDGGTPEALQVLGHGLVICDTHDNLDLAFVHVAVHPDHRGRGIGPALADVVVDRARTEGRTRLMAEVEFGAEPPADDPDAVVAPTGNGRIAGDLPGLHLARTAGLDLKMIARRSVLDLPPPDDVVTRLEQEARAAAGPQYRLHVWHDDIPDEWLAGYAALIERLTIDEPNPGLDLEPEHWDAERLRFEIEQGRSVGHQFVTTCVEHEPSGELVAATLLDHDPQHPAYSEQETTVVMPEHRGHRLGLLVKCVNLREHVRRWPAVERIWTWNNEDNPYMLAINIAMGFRPAGGSALLEADLADVRSVSG